MIRLSKTRAMPRALKNQRGGDGWYSFRPTTHTSVCWGCCSTSNQHNQNPHLVASQCKTAQLCSSLTVPTTYDPKSRRQEQSQAPESMMRHWRSSTLATEVKGSSGLSDRSSSIRMDL